LNHDERRVKNSGQKRQIAERGRDLIDYWCRCRCIAGTGRWKWWIWQAAGRMDLHSTQSFTATSTLLPPLTVQCTSHTVCQLCWHMVWYVWHHGHGVVTV